MEVRPPLGWDRSMNANADQPTGPTDDAGNGPGPARRDADEPVAPRTAVVTGAGRGIGRGIARGLADAGYVVALVGRTRENLEAVAAEIGDRARTVVVPVELTDGPGVRAAATTIEAALAPHGGVGLLVNNAGVIEEVEVPLADDDVEDVWRVIEVNVRGPLLLTHALLPGMLDRGTGRVVNINSGSGHKPAGRNTGYAISKGALSRLTTLLDAQYREHGVRSFDLAPGVVRTDMTTDMTRHEGRTDWTPVEASVELLLAMGDGRLDALSGRYVRAGSDTVAELATRTYDILVADARTLRLVHYGPTDPLAD